MKVIKSGKVFGDIHFGSLPFISRVLCHWETLSDTCARIAIVYCLWEYTKLTKKDKTTTNRWYTLKEPSVCHDWNSLCMMRVFSIILVMKAGDPVTIWVFYSSISSEEFRYPVQLLPPAGQLLSMQGHMEDSCGCRPLFMSSTVVDYVTWNWETPYKFMYKFAVNIFQWWKPCFYVW